MKYRTALLCFGLITAIAPPAQACFVGVRHAPSYEIAPPDEAVPWPSLPGTLAMGLSDLGVLDGDDVHLRCVLETVQADMTGDDKESERGRRGERLGLPPFSAASGGSGGTRRGGGGTPRSLLTFLSPVSGSLGGFFGASGSGGAGGNGSGSGNGGEGGDGTLAFVSGTDGDGSGGNGGNAGGPGFGPGDGGTDGLPPVDPGIPGTDPVIDELPGGPGARDIVTAVPEPGSGYLLSMGLLMSAGLSRRRRARQRDAASRQVQTSTG